MKRKAVTIIALLLITTGVILLVNSNYKVVKADPGFDSSFDTGGSSSSSSSDYSSGGSSDGSLTGIVVFVAIFGLLYLLGASGGVRPLSDEVIHKKLGNDFDIDHFKKYVFKSYNEVCIAWMNNDLDLLRKYLTNELYNMYRTQLLTLSSKKQKNIMEDITCLESEIVQINVLEKTVEIKTMLHITCKDYIINTETNEVVRGNKDKTNDYTYEITFVSDKCSDEIIKCPICKADVDGNNTSVCPYCRTVIIKESTKFVISQKEMVNQK